MTSSSKFMKCLVKEGGNEWYEKILQIASLENRLKQSGSKLFEFCVEMEIKGKHFLNVLLIVMIWSCVFFVFGVFDLCPDSGRRMSHYVPICISS